MLKHHATEMPSLFFVLVLKSLIHNSLKEFNSSSVESQITLTDDRFIVSHNASIMLYC